MDLVIRLVPAAGLGLLVAVVVTACIVEGCTYPYELAATTTVTFELDASHPVAASTVTVSLAATALPSQFAGGGARARFSLSTTQDLTLTLVPVETGVPLSVVAARGVASVPLMASCIPDQPCTMTMIAIVEWTRPETGGSMSPTLTAETIATIPHEDKLCGLPSSSVAIAASEPRAWAGAHDGMSEPSFQGAELVRHVTVTYDGPASTRQPAGADPVVARGHMGVTEPAASGDATPAPAWIPGVWLRVTPDDGGPPVLDGTAQAPYPGVPSDATFPVLAGCSAMPCTRGYWVQAVIFDPGATGSVDPPDIPYSWSFDASVTFPANRDESAGTLHVVADDSAAVAPPSLVMHGSGGPFHIDSGHPTHTLIVAVTAPGRPTDPLVLDMRSTATIQFGLTSTRVGATIPAGNGNGNGNGNGDGHLWLSNGHWVGDGSAGDDAADTGGWGGPGTYPSSVGRPFAVCGPPASACTARTGLVLTPDPPIVRTDSAAGTRKQVPF